MGYECLDKILKGGVVVVRVGERVREVDVAWGSQVVGDNGQRGDGDGNRVSGFFFFVNKKNNNVFL